MSNTKNVILQYPREVGGTTVSELRLRRPTVTDLRVLSQHGGIDGAIAMIARLSGQEVLFVEKLDAADFMAIQKVVDDFLPDSPPTGGM